MLVQTSRLGKVDIAELDVEFVDLVAHLHQLEVAIVDSGEYGANVSCRCHGYGMVVLLLGEHVSGGDGFLSLCRVLVEPLDDLFDGRLIDENCREEADQAFDTGFDDFQCFPELSEASREELEI